ncbi:MAG: hypothetical protein ACNS62_12460 [Candidatus Cyclobacteriaceae bacterium M3_2C_046]
MKNITLSIFFLILITPCSYGQQIKYKQVKDQYSLSEYNPKALQNPKYSPMAASIMNFYLPGLGHFYVAEPGRGLLFFGGEMLSAGFFVTGLVTVLTGEVDYGYTLMIAGAGAAGVILVTSIWDVVKVAKIKNMAIDDWKNQTISIQIQPYLDTGIHFSGGLTTLITF